MNENKIITYSFLAHLNNNNIGKGFNDIFIPLVKRTLSQLCNDNRYMGQITDIKEKFQELYGLDMPYPMLREILKNISIEINRNNKGNMTIYKDNAFCIEKYTFEDYEETILYKKQKIEKLEKIFKNYIEENVPILQYEHELDIFKFIDRNRIKLSTFLSSDNNSIEEISENADIEMEFIMYIKNTDIESYDTLKDIYIGSIISSYIEVDKIDSQNEKLKFVVDTNFIISLLGLHSEEAQDTCNKIIDICKRVGYKILISDYTIDETNHILSKIIEDKDTNIIEKYRYNSTQFICNKNNITKTDLELKKRKLNEFIASNGINIIYLKSKYTNQSKIINSELYKKLEETNYTNPNSILHDAILIDYVSNVRPKNGKNFSDMKIWFLTESKKLTNIKLKNNIYPTTITTSELVNILWLMRPILSTDDIFKLGLSNLFAEVIESKQPSRQIIREIDTNIKKYRDQINDDDIVELGLVVSNNSIKFLKDMNKSYEKINNMLIDEDFNRFSEEIRKMREEQGKALNEQKDKELEKIKNEHIKEKNNDFIKFMNTFINNKIIEYQEANNASEYECIELENINEKNYNNIKKAINCISIAIIVILGMALILYKNFMNQKFISNVIDVLLFASPIVFAGLFNLIVSKFINRFSNLINRKRRVKITEVKEKISVNVKNIELLNEIREILIGSIDAKKQMLELGDKDRYSDIINKLQLLNYVDENN